MSITRLGCRAFLIAIVVLPITLRAQAVNANAPSNQSAATASQGLMSSYQTPTPKEQFRRYMISAYGPLAFLRAGVAAGIDQARNTPEEWGQGAEGYGRRIGSQFGRSAITETTRYGLASVLHEDTKYYRCQCSGFAPRLRHALGSSFMARRPNGEAVFSIPDAVAPYTGAIVATYAWYPDRYGLQKGLWLGTRSLGVHVGFNVAREFLPRRRKR